MAKYLNLQKFDDYAKSAEKPTQEITEDGAPAGAPATVASVPGMGAPVLAGRGITGSGDVTMGGPKKKKRKVQAFHDFNPKPRKLEESEGADINKMMDDLKADGILTVGDIQTNKEGDKYVELTWPANFMQVTGSLNSALKNPMYLVHEMGMLNVKCDSPDDDDSNADARNIQDVYDTVTSEKEIEKYKASNVKGESENDPLVSASELVMNPNGDSLEETLKYPKKLILEFDEWESFKKLVLGKKDDEAKNISIEYKGYSSAGASKAAQVKLEKLLTGEFSTLKVNNVDDPDNPPTHMGGILMLNGPRDLLYKFCSKYPPHPYWKKENPSADKL